MAALHVCLVGAGFIGPVHAANVTRHSAARLAWVVDLDEQVGRSLADRHGARFTQRLDDALADALVGAVLICTPPRTHAAIIERAARAGKAILCEKPVDLDMTRVDACSRIVAETGVAFQLGFNRRYDPSHRALRDAVCNGEIGRTEMLVLSSRDPEIAPPAYVAAMPYGIFYDTIIHDLDTVRWLTSDEPAEVFARTAVMQDAAANPHRDPDTAMVMLTMRSGALVHINASFGAVYGYDQRIEAFGARGMLVSRNHQPTRLERYDATGIRQDPLLRFFVERYAESYVRELDDFIDAVRTGRAPSVTLDDGRRALALADAAVASVKSGRAVPVA